MSAQTSTAAVFSPKCMSRLRSPGSCRSIDELCDLSRGTERRWALSLDHESHAESRAGEGSAYSPLMLFAGILRGAEATRKAENAGWLQIAYEEDTATEQIRARKYALRILRATGSSLSLRRSQRRTWRTDHAQF